jgi:hypothetical protein
VQVLERGEERFLGAGVADLNERLKRSMADIIGFPIIT